MVGKNNKQVLREKQANKFKRYALKKLTVGLASVTIGTGLAFATSSSVSADELAVGERTVVVSDKTAEEQPQPDTPYLQEQEEAVTSAEEPQVTEDRISEERAVKTSEETDEKATESEEVAEEKQAASHEQTEETSDIEETNTKAPQAPATQLAPVAESVAEPVREEQSAEAPTTTLSQIDQLPEEFLTYLRDHSDIVDFKNAATIETYANLLQQSYGVEAAKEERIRAIEAAVKEIETTKEQAKNDVVDQTERLIDADKDSTTPQDQSKETFKKAIQQADNPQTVVESYLKDAGYKAEDIAGILANVDMSLANDPDQLLENIIQAGVKYANEHTQPGVLLANPQGRDVGHLINVTSQKDSELLSTEGTIYPLDNEKNREIKVRARLQFNNSYSDVERVEPGDYFDVKYNYITVDDINPNGRTGGSTPVLQDKNGNIIAFISDDREKGIIRYTFTEYVKNNDNIEVNLSYDHVVNRNKITKTGNYNIEYTIGTEKFTLSNVRVEYPKATAEKGNMNAKSSFVHVTDGDTYRQVIYINPLGKEMPNTNITLSTQGGTLNSQNSNVKVYKVLDKTKVSESTNANNYNDRKVFRDVTNQYPQLNNFYNNNTSGRANFGTINQNDMYVIVVDSETDIREGESVIGQLISYAVIRSGDTERLTVGDGLGNIGGSPSAATSTPRERIYSIGNYVWHDENRDGIQQQNELGIPNVEVRLLNNLGETIRTTRTNAKGHYEFNELSNGLYFVEFSTPEGFVPTEKNTNNNQNDDKDSDGTIVPVRISNADNMTIDSGFYRKVYSIGDKVWVDSNKDGIQDLGEQGLANVTVKLVDEFGNVKTTNTNQNGEYRFDNLDEGTYQVIFQTPEGYEATKPYQGDDRGQDSNAATTTIKVSPENPHFNEDRHNPTIDFGLVEVQPEVAEPERKVYSIGDKVWVDSDKDGVQDLGEQGLANVTVKLVDEFGNVQTTTTNRNGEYRFDNLDEGTYQVIFQTPEGYEATKPYQGNNRNQDSNAATTTIKVSPQNPHFNSNGHNSTIDFGLVEVQPQKLYEMTVEDSSFETHIYSEEEYNQLPGKTPQTVAAGKIKKVQSGKDRRVQVLYEHVNPDTLPQSTTDQFVDGFVNGKLVTEAGTFVQRNGQYWREVSRQVLQESQDEIFIYKPVESKEPVVPKFDIEDGKLYVTINGNRQEIGKVTGEPGEPGKTPTFEINEDGHLIAKFENEPDKDLGKVKGEPGAPGQNGNPGKDGRTPSVDTTRNKEAGETTITFYYDTNGDGKYTKDADELIRTAKVKDGKDATGTETVVEKGNEEPDNPASASGVWVTVYKTDADGNRLKDDSNNDIQLSHKFIRDGKDGKTPEVTSEIITDEEGNSIGSRTIIDDGRGKKQVIETSEIIEDGLIIGTKITVKEREVNDEGEVTETIISENEVLDGLDGFD
ncbi:SdrD B-like domain-containing protein, partial [Dolosigranulum pigrum]